MLPSPWAPATTHPLITGINTHDRNPHTRIRVASFKDLSGPLDVGSTLDAAAKILKIRLRVLFGEPQSETRNFDPRGSFKAS